MDSLKGEDLELYNSLKTKYTQQAAVEVQSNEVNNSQLTVPLPSTQGQQGSLTVPGSNVDVRMCQVCQGAGVCTEVYNHRRLEKYCTQCHGKGVRVFKSGVEVEEPEQQSDDTRNVQDTEDRSSASSLTTMTDTQAQDIHQDIQKIGSRIDNYQQEQRQTQARMADCKNATEKQLLQALSDQLSSQIQKLRRGRAKKEAQLLLAGRQYNSDITVAVP